MQAWVQGEVQKVQEVQPPCTPCTDQSIISGAGECRECRHTSEYGLPGFLVIVLVNHWILNELTCD